jgi:hypothetical protein
LTILKYNKKFDYGIPRKSTSSDCSNTRAILKVTSREITKQAMRKEYFIQK